jgi:hypothetical protein
MHRGSAWYTARGIGENEREITLNGADMSSDTTASASSIVFRSAIATKSDLYTKNHIHPRSQSDAMERKILHH